MKPTFEFDVRAFVNEQSLKLCSAEARLLWLYMLFFMHYNSKAYGYLPAHATPDKICEKAEIKLGRYPKLLKELETHEVFSVSTEEVIYCRRMVREAAREGGKDRAALRCVFDALVDHYPNATLVSLARNEFDRLCDDGTVTLENVGELPAGLDRWKGSKMWRQDNGKYIPSLNKWLAEKRWLDRPPQDEMARLRNVRQSSSGRDPMARWVPKTNNT